VTPLTVTPPLRMPGAMAQQKELKNLLEKII
jgi:hypothetical protein